MTVAVGVDLGGTHVRAALVDQDGTLLRRKAARTRRDAGVMGVIEQIGELVNEVAREATSVSGVGVAVPGPVDHATGVVRFAPNLPEWRDVPVQELLQERFACPVYVGNDANLAALAEHRFGAGRGTRHMVYITVSTGVGGGIIVDGRLLLGRSGYAGEIGHHVVKEDGPRCHCGNVGCLEALASGTAIAREARIAVVSGEPTVLAEWCEGDVWRVDAAMVARAAQAGDEVAARILTQAGHYLGVGILNVLHIFNPERVVLGGGVLQAGEWITRPMWEVLRARVHPGYLQEGDIVPAALGDDVGLLGAAALVWHEEG